MMFGSEKALHARQAMRLVIEQHHETMLQLKPSFGSKSELDCTQNAEDNSTNLLICFLVKKWL